MALLNVNFDQNPERWKICPCSVPPLPRRVGFLHPAYLLRRRRILRQLQDFHPCDVIEIGCGAGMLLQELSARGFRCQALESSPQARELITRLSVKTGQKVTVHDEADLRGRGRFPLVMAFEVLEHIEGDDAAMKQWASWLAPGGTLLLSVPAHPRLWSAADEWAGHYRRYRQQDLIDVVDGRRPQDRTRGMFRLSPWEISPNRCKQGESGGACQKPDPIRTTRSTATAAASSAITSCAGTPPCARYQANWRCAAHLRHKP